jgi:hypothetical protein
MQVQKAREELEIKLGGYGCLAKPGIPKWKAGKIRKPVQKQTSFA